MPVAKSSINRSTIALGLALAAGLAACTPSPHDLVAAGKEGALRERLSENHALLNSRDRLGKTPLHHAVTFNQIAIMPLLLEAGANLDAQDVTGMTPLHGAALMGNAAAAQWLAEAGANLEARDKFGDTPAHTAALFGRSSVLRVLAAFGADLKSENSEHMTPLLLARHYGMEDTAANILRLIIWVRGKSADERMEILQP